VVKTNEFGSYYLGGLPIGLYDVNVSKEGFQTARLESIQILVVQIRTLDLPMTISTAEQQGGVVAAATPLAQSSADVGGVILNQQVTNLPINGRNWTALLGLVPGAIDSGGANQQTIRFAGRGNYDRQTPQIRRCGKVQSRADVTVTDRALSDYIGRYLPSTATAASRFPRGRLLGQRANREASRPTC
jgi:hypothetical protein